jgi:thiamine-monophosphate kinase
MDSSDGLADAIVQICRASGVGATLDLSCLPISPLLYKLAASDVALQWTLYGGEDFELVLCLPREIAATLVEQLDAGAAIIGRVNSEPDCQLVDSDRSIPVKILNLNEGFQHF